MDEIVEELSYALESELSLSKRLGHERGNLCLFCDLGDANSDFLTIGYYLIPERCMIQIQPRLAQIRENFSIKSELSWKKRKKGGRHQAIREWMEVIRSTPGMGYVVAVDSRLKNHPFYRDPIKQLARAEAENPEMIWRIIWLCMFAALIGKYLESTSTVKVYFDPDPCKDTKSREEMIGETLRHYLETLNVKRAAALALCRNIADRRFDDFLSLPDLLASSISGCLRLDGTLLPPDIYGSQILRELSAMPPISKNAHGRGCSFDATLISWDEEAEAMHNKFVLKIQHIYLQAQDSDLGPTEATS